MSKSVKTITHKKAGRKNIPTAEYQSVMGQEEQSPLRAAYQRRNRDLDPQLVWRGKDKQDSTDLEVQAPPLYIQEKISSKVLIDDLIRCTAGKVAEPQAGLFADFNGVPEGVAKTEFYQHNANWSNRMILGDSLQVMASLAERENLYGKVQCIYLDPPYGIKFNSNFQWSTTSRIITDGNVAHITREPEQVKAFRDTWRDGIHSYLTYLRDRLTVARDLLTDSGSIFVQIGDKNVHRVQILMDEVFGGDNFVNIIPFRKKTSPQKCTGLTDMFDYLLWFAKDKNSMKDRKLYIDRDLRKSSNEFRYRDINGKRNTVDIFSENQNDWSDIYRTTAGVGRRNNRDDYKFELMIDGKKLTPPQGYGWIEKRSGMENLIKGNRVSGAGMHRICKIFYKDFPCEMMTNVWADVSAAQAPTFVVETDREVAQRCILMTTDPGDLVLDPTCGSGTTAYVAEQWGRRWITIDTSRVALALARARIMGARFPYYLLVDSKEGKRKEAEITRTDSVDMPTGGDVRQGFVCERAPHITLKSIANNAEIGIIWEKFQETLDPLRAKLNIALKQQWEEWEIPRDADGNWSTAGKKTHAEWSAQCIARQQEIDASIDAAAEFEHLHDKPYQADDTVRVAGPFTVESLSPHRVLGVDENDELIDQVADSCDGADAVRDFAQIIIENLMVAGVQQNKKKDKIDFSSIESWPGRYICADGRYQQGGKESAKERRAAIFIGPEFGTVSRPDVVAAAREAAEGGFDDLIVCAFSYDARVSDISNVGRVSVLKARMNADLHMADNLKQTDKANLFVIFGEPDIEILTGADGQVSVKIKGVDVFHPNKGEVRSGDIDDIACWFIDTDYNEESFFVRHAYFLGAGDPYKALKTSLKAEINAETWVTLHTDTSRPFPKPQSGRIAVKVINHLGDEVMKVFRV